VSSRETAFLSDFYLTRPRSDLFLRFLSSSLPSATISPSTAQPPLDHPRAVYLARGLFRPSGTLLPASISCLDTLLIILPQLDLTGRANLLSQQGTPQRQYLPSSFTSFTSSPFLYCTFSLWCAPSSSTSYHTPPTLPRNQGRLRSICLYISSPSLTLIRTISHNVATHFISFHLSLCARHLPFSLRS
jgi:hypothetical protein